jgi:membrane fusion protein, epimerase transport system
LRVNTERATVERLEAETELSPTLAFSDELRAAAQEDPRIDEALGKEHALFASRRDALDSESRLLLEQRTHIQAEIESLEAEVQQAESSLALQQRDLERSRELVTEGFVSVTRVNELEAEVADYASRLEQRRSEVARAQQRLVDTNLKLNSARNAYIQYASDQLKTAVARQGELEQELRKSEDAAERQLVTAPADGVVIDLKFTSPGAVVQPGESIADVVPSDAPLLIEAQIRPEDITHVVQGQQARIKVLAYRYSDTITGVVDYVSADRLIDPAGYPYYTAMIEADKVSLQAAGDVKLQAGMPVEVYIEGTAQTALQYMIEPITATLRKAATPL